MSCAAPDPMRGTSEAPLTLRVGRSLLPIPPRPQRVESPRTDISSREIFSRERLACIVGL